MFTIYLQFKIVFRYVIPPEYGNQFEQLVAKLFLDEAAKCSAFIRHKIILLMPQILNKHYIPFNTVRIHITYHRLDKQHILQCVLFVSGITE